MGKQLIIGANGYLGRQLAHVLKQNGSDLHLVDIHEQSIDGHLNYQQIDITKSESVGTLAKDYKVVYMFAGMTGTKSDPDSRKLYTAVNEGGLKNVLEHYKNESLRLVFPSTRLVYRGVKDTFLTEDAEKESKTVYAENKINCERLLEQYSKSNPLTYTIFRICVPYGNLIDDHYSYGTLGFFLGKATKGDDITLFGNGEQKRTFTHVKDIVGAILATLKSENSTNNTYNIGSDDALSLKHVAELIASKYGVNVVHVPWPPEALNVESGDTIFADDKLRAHSNYVYQLSLKNWIEALDL